MSVIIVLLSLMTTSFIKGSAASSSSCLHEWLTTLQLSSSSSTSVLSPYGCALTENTDSSSLKMVVAGSLSTPSATSMGWLVTLEGRGGEVVNSPRIITKIADLRVNFTHVVAINSSYVAVIGSYFSSSKSALMWCDVERLDVCAASATNYIGTVSSATRLRRNGAPPCCDHGVLLAVNADKQILPVEGFSHQLMAKAASIQQAQLRTYGGTRDIDCVAVDVDPESGDIFFSGGVDVIGDSNTIKDVFVAKLTDDILRSGWRSVSNASGPVSAISLAYAASLKRVVVAGNMKDDSAGWVPFAVALNADTGAEVWLRAVPVSSSYITSACVVVNDIVVIAVSSTTKGSQLIVFNASTGEQIWARLLTNRSSSMPFVVSQLMYGSSSLSTSASSASTLPSSYPIVAIGRTRMNGNDIRFATAVQVLVQVLAPNGAGRATRNDAPQVCNHTSSCFTSLSTDTITNWAPSTSLSFVQRPDFFLTVVGTTIQPLSQATVTDAANNIVPRTDFCDSTNTVSSAASTSHTTSFSADASASQSISLSVAPSSSQSVTISALSASLSTTFPRTITESLTSHSVSPSTTNPSLSSSSDATESMSLSLARRISSTTSLTTSRSAVISSSLTSSKSSTRSSTGGATQSVMKATKTTIFHLSGSFTPSSLTHLHQSTSSETQSISVTHRICDSPWRTRTEGNNGTNLSTRSDLVASSNAALCLPNMTPTTSDATGGGTSPTICSTDASIIVLDDSKARVEFSLATTTNNDDSNHSATQSSTSKEWWRGHADASNSAATSSTTMMDWNATIRIVLLSSSSIVTASSVPCWVVVPLGGDDYDDATDSSSFSSMWRVGSLSAFAGLNTTGGASVHFYVKENSTTSSSSSSSSSSSVQCGLLYVFVSEFPSSSSTGRTVSVPSQLVLTCEGYHIYVSVVLQWPEKTVSSVATEVLTTTATVVSLALNAADVTSAVSAVLVTFLSCTAEPPGRSAVAYILSVFFDLGYGAMAIGNALLVVALLAVHGACAWVLHRFRPSRIVVEDAPGESYPPPTPDDHHHLVRLPTLQPTTSKGNCCSELAMPALFHFVVHNLRTFARVRFPSYSLQAAALLAPGSVFGAAAALSMMTDDSTGGDETTTSTLSAVGAVLGLLLSLIVMAVIPGVLLHSVVLRLCHFTPYSPPLPGPAWEQRILYPHGRWSPEKPCRAFRPLFVPMRAPRYCYLIGVESILALLLAGVTGAIVGSSGDGGGGRGSAACGIGPIIVALTQYAYFAALVFVRPHRLPMDRVCTPLYHALLGTVCTLKYIGGDQDEINNVADSVQQSLVCVQLWKTVWGAYVMWYREGRYRSQLKQMENLQRERDMNNNNGLELLHEFNTDKCRDEEGDIEVELLPLHDDEDASDDDEDVNPLQALEVGAYNLEGIEQLYWDDQGAALLMIGEGEDEGEENRCIDDDGVNRTLSDYAQILANTTTATSTTMRNPL
ncbi:membrane-associated protein, putative [Bodo saltans]|uniref:Membrane-associated protein, putative n=1 Tax=Bodo saltans TaxID=75058 RepID=A0A0S4IJY3_BODSA|nr:membrane-associated protein, putative [Bodo saltans]|eukprot:CUE62061.1 membrane-associated protein, putative [Bodo saltans]